MSDPISASKPHLSTGVSRYKPHYWPNDRNTLAGNVADGNVREREGKKKWETAVRGVPMPGCVRAAGMYLHHMRPSESLEVGKIRASTDNKNGF